MKRLSKPKDLRVYYKGKLIIKADTFYYMTDTKETVITIPNMIKELERHFIRKNKSNKP